MPTVIRKGKEILNFIMILLVLFILFQIITPVCSADNNGEERLTMIIRSEFLPEGISNGNMAKSLRNPFIWSDGQSARLDQFDGPAGPDPFDKLVLNGIIMTGNTPVVIINNRQLRKGDMIDGIKVGEISGDSVVLLTNKSKRTLKFPVSGIDFSTLKAEAK